MHGQVGPPLEQRQLELLDEQPLAADLGERAIEDPVALGRHPEDLDAAVRVQRAQAVAHVLGLPHRKPAFARCDHQALRRAAR